MMQSQARKARMAPARKRGSVAVGWATVDVWLSSPWAWKPSQLRGMFRKKFWKCERVF